MEHIVGSAERAGGADPTKGWHPACRVAVGLVTMLNRDNHRLTECVHGFGVDAPAQPDMKESPWEVFLFGSSV
jgi:hypothetical protein